MLATPSNEVGANVVLRLDGESSSRANAIVNVTATNPPTFHKPYHHQTYHPSYPITVPSSTV